MFKNFNLFVAAPKTGDISDMQFYYDKCLPGNSTLLNNYDAVTMEDTYHSKIAYQIYLQSFCSSSKDWRYI